MLLGSTGCPTLLASLTPVSDTHTEPCEKFGYCKYVQQQEHHRRKWIS